MSEWEWFRGDYATWREARCDSAGYDESAILDRVVTATRAVRDGRAAFERDGVAFPTLHENYPLLYALFRIAAGNRNRLRVVDFGGALGSAFWQHRRALAALDTIEWRVVEQMHFVEAGRREFSLGGLSFWPSLDAATADGAPDLLFTSGALQYVEAPWRLIEAIVALGAPYMLFERLPLWPEGRDRLTVEQVPPEYGATSYPSWFLDEARFLATVEPAYEALGRYATLLDGGVPETWTLGSHTVPNQGLFLRRRDASSGESPAAVGVASAARRGWRRLWRRSRD